MLPALVVALAACPMPTVPLPAREPQRTPGPSELVAGLYVQGGALLPGCTPEPRGPFAGTLTVEDPAGGRVIARVTRRHDGRLFVVRLPPGTYAIVAVTAGGLRAVPQTVTIPRHRTVRQDEFVDVP